MKPTRKLIICAIAALLLWQMGSEMWRRHSVVDSETIFRASTEYSRQRLDRSQPLPATVSLNDLAAKGFLPRSAIPFGTGWRRVSLSQKPDAFGKPELVMNLPGAEGHYRLHR